MPNWNTTLDLQDVWSGCNTEIGRQPWTDKTVHQLAKEIVRRLGRKFPARLEGAELDFELDDVITAFNGVETAEQWQKALDYATSNGSDEEFAFIRDNTPIEQFDEAMASLYDWADANRVWVNK